MLDKKVLEKFMKKVSDSISIVKNKVTDEISLSHQTYTVQKIRTDIKGEYDAIALYEQHVLEYQTLLEETGDPVYNDLIKVTKDIIQEEQVHVGELNELLNKVNPNELSKFEEGVKEAQEKINNTSDPTKTDVSEVEDERLSPQTYRKLKELGYNSEKWKNLTQEQANKIVHSGDKPTIENKNKENVTTKQLKKEKVLAVPEGSELRKKILSDTEGKMTVNEIANDPLVRKMAIDSEKSANEIRQKYHIPEGQDTFTIDTPERKKMRENATNNILNRGSISGKDERGNDVFEGPVKKEYRAEIVLGAPAGGKSSVIVNKVSKNTGSMVLDSDEIKKLLPGFEDGLGAGLVHRESADIILEKMVVPEFGKGGSKEGSNLTIPIVGKNPKAALRYLKILKEVGYKVHLSFNDVSTLNSVKRATTRAIETGRFLSPEYLQSIGDKPSQTYEYLKTFDENGVHFDTFTKYNNNVKYGEPAQLLEHLNFEGNEAEKEDWR